MKKILCPVDFSETSRNAMAYAAKVAQARQCELTLFYAQPIHEKATTSFLGDDQISGEIAQQFLDERASEISKVFKISCSAEIQESSRALSSILHDKGKQYDLVIIGTEGPEDLYEFFTGSKVYKVAIASETPILLVPQGCLYSELKRIVYAFDFHQERDLPLYNVVQFAKEMRCHLTILQVSRVPQTKESETQLNDIKLIMSNLYEDDIHFSFDTLYSNETANAIDHYILNHECDALALCSVHRNMISRLFHKSIIQDLTALSNYPILVFHE